MSWISRARTGAGVSSFLSSPTAVAASVAAVSVAATWAAFNILKSPLSGESRDIGDARRRLTGSGTSDEKDNSNASAAEKPLAIGNRNNQAQQLSSERLQLTLDAFAGFTTLSRRFPDTDVTLIFSRGGMTMKATLDPQDKENVLFSYEDETGRKGEFTILLCVGLSPGSDSGYISESEAEQE